MFSKSITAFLILLLNAGDSVGMEDFEKTTYSNGTVACVLDPPSRVVYLDQIVDQDGTCIPPGVRCALQCNDDPQCTNYNYKRNPRRCELFHFTPSRCTVMQGCYHAAQASGDQSCGLQDRPTFSTAAESTSSLSDATDSLQAIWSDANSIQSMHAWTSWSPIITKLTTSKAALSANGSSAQSYSSQTAFGETTSKTATATVPSLLSTIISSPTSAKLTASNTAIIPTSQTSNTQTAATGQTTSKTATATVQSILSTIIGLSSTSAKLTTSYIATQTTIGQTNSETATLLQILSTTTM